MVNARRHSPRKSESNFVRACEALVVCAVIATACSSSSPPPLRWSDYERNCGVSSDCVAIATATECECPLCDNMAINQADEQTYQKARASYEAACKGTPCSNFACVAVTPYCDNGTCQVK